MRGNAHAGDGVVAPFFRAEVGESDDAEVIGFAELVGDFYDKDHGLAVRKALLDAFFRAVVSDGERREPGAMPGRWGDGVGRRLGAVAEGGVVGPLG